MELFSVEGLLALLMLILLQAVLGFDNLLYISIESKRVPLEHQQRVRRWGIGLAIANRVLSDYHDTHVVMACRSYARGEEAFRKKWSYSFVQQRVYRESFLLAGLFETR